MFKWVVEGNNSLENKLEHISYRGSFTLRQQFVDFSIWTPPEEAMLQPTAQI